MSFRVQESLLAPVTDPIEQSRKRQREGADENGGPQLKREKIERTTAAAAAEAGQKVLKKLSVHLLKTYEGINQRYYEAKKKAAPASSEKRALTPEELKLNEAYEENIKMWLSSSPLKQPSGKVAKGGYGYLLRGINGKELVGKMQSPHRAKYPEGFARAAETETSLLETLTKENAPHIVRQLKSFSAPPRRYAQILENAGINLYEKYFNIRNPDKKEASIGDIERIAKQLLEALAHIHTPNKETNRQAIGHFDIKPENILEKEKEIRLADFGLAEELPPNGVTTQHKFSRPYQPPETIFSGRTSLSGDIWAAGCTLYELMMGEFLIPLENSKKTTTLLLAIRDRLDLPDLLMKRCFPGEFRSAPRRLKPFSEAILTKENSPKAKQFVDLLSQMLKIDPKARKSASELLTHPFFTSDQESNSSFSAAASTPSQPRTLPPPPVFEEVVDNRPTPQPDSSTPHHPRSKVKNSHRKLF